MFLMLSNPISVTYSKEKNNLGKPNSQHLRKVIGTIFSNNFIVPLQATA